MTSYVYFIHITRNIQKALKSIYINATQALKCSVQATYLTEVIFRYFEHCKQLMEEYSKPIPPAQNITAVMHGLTI